MFSAPSFAQSPQVVISWNDLGMHCMDPDFSVFSILPPFNTQHAQVVSNGRLLGPTEAHVTYEGVADPTGSINTTSIGKTEFWSYVDELFGVSLPLDVGLAGYAMPGAGNVPQDMHYDPTWNWHTVEGLPITPIDDAFQKNPYSLLKMVARSPGGAPLASTTPSVPVSQELACSLCHDSGANPAARPPSGWEWDSEPLRDHRWNILRLHDDQHLADQAYVDALVTVGYSPAGMYATAKAGTPILCARCHGSNALPGTGLPGISAMTAAIHSLHGNVMDPAGNRLDDIPTRASCYTCHPGNDTKCMRGAMGKAIGANGEYAMQCQNCHGGMAQVGDPTRIAWLEEPNCQACHTGTATQNAGAIRFTDAFDAPGHLREPADARFATNADTPGTGFSLYRFSSGHGELQCSACHGSPHAIYPTSEPNDNLQTTALQGHPGTLNDCTVCHGNREDDEVQGPHGMHPVDTKWVRDNHKDQAQLDLASCQACHGVDFRGTVLSRAQGPRSFDTVTFGTKNFFEGFEVGCYVCHQGPHSDDRNNNRAPAVTDQSLSTPSDVAIGLGLSGTDADGDSLTLRIVSQPQHGAVAFDGTTATYRAWGGYVGADSFTFAASDGDTESNLGTVSVDVTPGVCGSMIPYGFGCPGTGGFLPYLSGSGCAAVGEQITVHVEHGLGGALAMVVVGFQRAAFEASNGCVLRTDPLIPLRPLLRLQGAGAGNGTLDLSTTVPPEFAGLTLTVQALVFDPGAKGSLSATNGLELKFQ